MVTSAERFRRLRRHAAIIVAGCLSALTARSRSSRSHGGVLFFLERGRRLRQCHAPWPAQQWAKTAFTYVEKGRCLWRRSSDVGLGAHARGQVAEFKRQLMHPLLNRRDPVFEITVLRCSRVRCSFRLMRAAA